MPNLCCVSVPVSDRDGGASVAAISVAMPKMRFKRTFVPRWCELMREKAALITQQLASDRAPERCWLDPRSSWPSA